MRSLYFLVLVIYSTAISLAQDGTIDASAPAENAIQLDITQLYGTIKSDHIKRDITIRTDTNNRNFFHVPLLLPNWKEFKSALDKWKQTQPQPDDIGSIDLEIYFWDGDVEAELIEKLNKKLASANVPPITGSELSVIPYAFYQIEANFGNGLIPIFMSEDLARIRSNGVKLVSNVSINRQQIIPVQGTLDELQYLYDNRKQELSLVGSLYSVGHSVTPSVMAVDLRTLLLRKATADLFGDEEFSSTTTTKTTSEGGGLSINLSRLKFGGITSRAEVQTKVSRKRVVSRDFVSDFVESSLQGMDINYTGTEDDFQRATQLVDFILSTCKQVTVEFDTKSKDQWRMGNAVLGYVNLNKLQIEEVLKSSPNIKSTDEFSTESNAELDGMKGSKKSSSKFDFDLSNQISWERKGDVWVPTKVDLHILDQANLERQLRISWSKNIVSKDKSSYLFKFIYPAAELYETDREWHTFSKDILTMKQNLESFQRKTWPPAPENIVNHKTRISINSSALHPVARQRAALFFGDQPLEIPLGKHFVVTEIETFSGNTKVTGYLPVRLLSFRGNWSFTPRWDNALEGEPDGIARYVKWLAGASLTDSELKELETSQPNLEVESVVRHEWFVNDLGSEDGLRTKTVFNPGISIVGTTQKIDGSTFINVAPSVSINKDTQIPAGDNNIDVLIRGYFVDANN